MLQHIYFYQTRGTTSTNVNCLLPDTVAGYKVYSILLPGDQHWDTGRREKRVLHIHIPKHVQMFYNPIRHSTDKAASEISNILFINILFLHPAGSIMGDLT